MRIELRPIEPADAAFLREMLYEAVYWRSIEEGTNPRSMMRPCLPVQELARRSNAWEIGKVMRGSLPMRTPRRLGRHGIGSGRTITQSGVTFRRESLRWFLPSTVTFGDRESGAWCWNGSLGMRPSTPSNG